VNCKQPMNDVSLRAGQSIRASDDANIYMREVGGTRIGRSLAFIGFIAGALLQPALADPPKFQVDPTWPQTLPSKWIIGTIGGIFVDAQDHIWINQRPSSLDAREKRASTATNVICCVPAPPVIEFDQAGNVVQGWGGDGPDYKWGNDGHGIFVDHNTADRQIEAVRMAGAGALHGGGG
jgi:hypothetical protein